MEVDPPPVAESSGQTHQNGYSDDSDDELDPVIKTIPVYFTPALAKQTSLLCYPHKKPDRSTPFPLLPPSLRDEHHARRILARSKPNVGRLEMSVPLEVDTGHSAQRFNIEKAKEYRQGVDARDLGATKEDKSRKRRNDEDLENEKPLERITLRGEAVPDQTNYCVGILKDGALALLERLQKPARADSRCARATTPNTSNTDSPTTPRFDISRSNHISLQSPCTVRARRR